MQALFSNWKLHRQKRPGTRIYPQRKVSPQPSPNHRPHIPKSPSNKFYSNLLCQIGEINHDWRVYRQLYTSTTIWTTKIQEIGLDQQTHEVRKVKLSPKEFLHRSVFSHNGRSSILDTPAYTCLRSNPPKWSLVKLEYQELLYLNPPKSFIV